MYLFVSKSDKMTQKSDMTAPNMTRVTVRVPKTTLDQINDWVDRLGVRRSHFLGIALVAGVRSLIRASALELALDTDIHSEKGKAATRHEAPTVENLSAVVETLKAEVAALKTELASLQTRQEGKKRS
jgi:metal-responsive CopG/Arc/MetJ family transcriptional regulator